MDTIGLCYFRTEKSISVPNTIDLSSRLLNGASVPVLEWNEEDYSMGKNWVTSGPITGCLEDFIALANGNAEDVYAFARRRSVLGIWPVRQSNGHAGRYYEPTSIYIKCAKQVVAIQALAEKLRREEVVRSKYEWDQASWYPLDDVGYTLTMKAWPHDEDDKISVLYSQRLALSSIISHWLSSSRVRPSIDTPSSIEETKDGFFFSPVMTFGRWSDGSYWDTNLLQTPRLALADEMELPSVYQRPSPLFGVIAVQLALSVMMPPGIYQCGNCGRFFNPALLDRNKPRSNAEKTYCSSECRAARKGVDKKIKRAIAKT